MMQLKYAAKTIGQMSGVEVDGWSKGLLLKIHVITGWVIPEKELLSILVDQFQKKLVEDYPMLNVDEIEYAFRQQASKPDWGKTMNLALIDEVLVPYLKKRYQVSSDEEKKLEPPPQVLLTDQQLEDIQRGDIEAFYQRCRNGKHTYGAPDYFKDILVKDKLMEKNDDISSFFVQRLGKGFENIYVPVKQTP